MKNSCLLNENSRFGKISKSRSIRKLILQLFVILFGLTTSFAQTTTNELSAKPPKPCALSLKDAPELGGLKIGMSVQEVEKTLGTKLKLTDEPTEVWSEKQETIPRYIKKGEVNIGVKAYYYLDDNKSGTQGAANQPKLLIIRFFNDKVFYILKSFDDGKGKWKNIRDAALFYSTQLNLPADGWLFSDSSLIPMTCKDFRLMLSLDPAPNLLIADTVTENEIKRLAEKAFEAEKKQ